MARDLVEVDVSKVPLYALIQEIYNLSKPQGLGFLHFVEGPMKFEDAEVLALTANEMGKLVIALDYVTGRACKMQVYRAGHDSHNVIYFPWFDHTEAQEKQLLAFINKYN